MKSFISYSLLAAAAACGIASAVDTATTNPVGYTTVTALPNSDTIVGLPLRLAAAAAGALSGAPVVSATTAELPVASGTFAPSAFAGTHYVKFASGTAEGKFYPVTANSASSITVDLNGDTVPAISGDKFEVIKFWTLGELFDPSASTSDPLTTGNAIVASTNILGSGRRTEILIPNTSAPGINLSSAATYFINAGVWKKVGQGNTSFNNDQLWPDTYFIIRNPSTVTSATKYVIAGEVETKKFTAQLSTQAGVRQDNFVALPRPVDVTLNGLGLGGTAAFIESTNILGSGRRDELIVFNNAAPGINKSSNGTYFYNAGVWKKVGSGNTDVGSDIIPAGSGIIVRKYQSGTGATAFFNNPPTY